MTFHVCCFYFSAVIIVGVPFPFGVYDRMWNSIVSVPDHCLLNLLCYNTIVFYSKDLLGI